MILVHSIIYKRLKGMGRADKQLERIHRYTKVLIVMIGLLTVAGTQRFIFFYAHPVVGCLVTFCKFWFGYISASHFNQTLQQVLKEKAEGGKKADDMDIVIAAARNQVNAVPAWTSKFFAVVASLKDS